MHIHTYKHTHVHTSTYHTRARTHTLFLTLGPTLSLRRGNYEPCRTVIGQSVSHRGPAANGRPPGRGPTPIPGLGGSGPGNVTRGAGLAATPSLGPRPPALGRATACAPGFTAELPEWPRRASAGSRAEGTNRRPRRPAHVAPPCPSPPPERGGRHGRRPERSERRAGGRPVGWARTAPAHPARRRGRCLPAGPDASAPGSGSRAGRACDQGAARHFPTGTGHPPRRGRPAPRSPQSRRPLPRCRRLRSRTRHDGPGFPPPHREPAGGRGQGLRARGPGRRRRETRRTTTTIGGRGRGAGAERRRLTAETALRRRREPGGEARPGRCLGRARWALVPGRPPVPGRPTLWAAAAGRAGTRSRTEATEAASVLTPATGTHRRQARRWAVLRAPGRGPGPGAVQREVAELAARGPAAGEEGGGSWGSPAAAGEVACGAAAAPQEETRTVFFSRRQVLPLRVHLRPEPLPEAGRARRPAASAASPRRAPPLRALPVFLWYLWDAPKRPWRRQCAGGRRGGRALSTPLCPWARPAENPSNMVQNVAEPQVTLGLQTVARLDPRSEEGITETLSLPPSLPHRSGHPSVPIRSPGAHDHLRPGGLAAEDASGLHDRWRRLPALAARVTNADWDLPLLLPLPLPYAVQPPLGPHPASASPGRRPPRRAPSQRFQDLLARRHAAPGTRARAAALRAWTPLEERDPDGQGVQACVRDRRRTARPSGAQPGVREAPRPQPCAPSSEICPDASRLARI
nr:homeobox protein HMX1 [Camelus dromedarius]